MDRPFELGSAELAAHQDLVTIGTAVLKEPTQRVADPRTVIDLCTLLVTRLRDINGAGLAANQIGVCLRVMVFEVKKTELHPDRPESPLYVMINPDILERSDQTEDGWEGCFSVPEYMGLVPRSISLTCRYDTTDGATHVERFEGYMARVIQHECDHLDGKIYLEQMKSMLDLSTQANFKHFRRPTPACDS